MPPKRRAAGRVPPNKKDDESESDGDDNESDEQPDTDPANSDTMGEDNNNDNNNNDGDDDEEESGSDEDEDEEEAAEEEEEDDDDDDDDDEDLGPDPLHCTVQLAGEENSKIVHFHTDVVWADFRKKIAVVLDLPIDSKFEIARKRKKSAKAVTKKSFDQMVDDYYDGDEQFLRLLVTPQPGFGPGSASVEHILAQQQQHHPQSKSASPLPTMSAALDATALMGGTMLAAAAAAAASPLHKQGSNDLSSPIINAPSALASSSSMARPMSSYSRESDAADQAIKAMFEQRTPSGEPVEVQWTDMRVLGRGAFGSVHEAITNSGHIVAVKHLVFPAGSDGGRSTAEQADQLVEEIRLMKHLRHRNIVGYYGSQTKAMCGADGGRTIDIFMEACHGGSLNSLRRKVDKVKGRLPVFLVRSYIKQVLEGLVYLHLKGIVHRDLKGDNILIDGRGVPKLADFGCSKKLGGHSFEDTLQLEVRDMELRASMSASSTGTIPHPAKNDNNSNNNGGGAMARTLVGTPIFIAPEVLTEDARGYATSADIWSVACLVIELFGKKAWNLANASVFSVMFAIAQSKSLPTGMPDLARSDPKLIDFLTQCFNRDPAARPTARQLLEHAWITCPEAELREPVWLEDLEAATAAAAAAVASPMSEASRVSSSSTINGSVKKN